MQSSDTVKQQTGLRKGRIDIYDFFGRGHNVGIRSTRNWPVDSILGPTKPRAALAILASMIFTFRKLTGGIGIQDPFRTQGGFASLTGASFFGPQADAVSPSGTSLPNVQDGVPHTGTPSLFCPPPPPELEPYTTGQTQ